MSFIEVNHNKAYYEVHGEGETSLVILNGIMMSSASWQPFMGMLSKQFKVVLLDFYDQGKSEYLETTYTQDLQVELVKELLTALDLKQVTLMGISYGGEVAMKFAVKYQQMLSKLVLANTTAYTNQQLKAIGDSWIYSAKTYDGKQFFKATIPPIYSSEFYESRVAWLDAREKLFDKVFDEKWYEGFIRLVISAETHDVRDQINVINIPTLIIGADEDIITPLSCQEQIHQEIKNSRFVVIKHCGHASMYEKPIEFFSTVMGFVTVGHEHFVI
ncbi:alpha/beta hydrolase [Fusibacter bizertensis]|uniref:Alpha/beta hydrolase n=1 Tax=Fusibacter bizertensis TaxID=1488331 RepID=A0ABT6NBZ3_9FIRM|nr:alpha/beta hydrolase [Fusibacter bizertensis]MDH8677938.1 alpha/beta hydrolase [Fusibacter bizertensis]